MSDFDKHVLKVFFKTFTIGFVVIVVLAGIYLLASALLGRDAGFGIIATLIGLLFVSGMITAVSV